MEEKNDPVEELFLFDNSKDAFKRVNGVFVPEESSPVVYEGGPAAIAILETRKAETGQERSEIRSPRGFGDWPKLQAKARESRINRLLDPAYILHDWMVSEKVNPEFRPFRLIYGAAGVDLSNAFLSTDMKEGLFISDYFGWTANVFGNGVVADLKKLEDPSFRRQMLAAEWAEQYRIEKRKWGYSIGDRLHIPDRRLAALAVELDALGLENIQVISEDQYPVLTFPWRHPLANETTLRTVTFIDADITRPTHYASTLRGKFDGYYQRAGQEVPLDYERDPRFISELQKFLVEEGYFITDDYAYDPASEMSGVRAFTDQGSRFPLGLPRLSISHDKELADAILELRGKGVLSDTPSNRYGWDVRIRKSVRSEIRNKDQVPSVKTSEARPSIPTAFMAKVVDVWEKVNKLNLRSEPSPLDVKSVQANKEGFVFVGDSTEFERAVAAWAGLIDGTEEGYQWMGKAAESQRNMGYGKKHSFVENARMAANYLSENVDWYAYQQGAIVLNYDDSTGNGYVAVLDRGDNGFPVKKGGELDIELVEGGFLAQKSESKGTGIAMGRIIKEGALTIISHGQVAEIKKGEKKAREVISHSYDGTKAKDVAAFKGLAVIVRFTASRSEVRKVDPESDEAMTSELEAAQRQFKWWSKKIPAWTDGEKQKIPQVLKALHEAGFSLRGGTVQMETSEEGARVVFGVLGTPRTPSSVYNKALQRYKDRGGWDAALREAGLDPVAIKREQLGFIELRNMKNGKERKWPAAGPRSEIRSAKPEEKLNEQKPVEGEPFLKELPGNVGDISRAMFRRSLGFGNAIALRVFFDQLLPLNMTQKGQSPYEHMQSMGVVLDKIPYKMQDLLAGAGIQQEKILDLYREVLSDREVLRLFFVLHEYGRLARKTDAENGATFVYDLLTKLSYDPAKARLVSELVRYQDKPFQVYAHRDQQKVNGVFSKLDKLSEELFSGKPQEFDRFLKILTLFSAFDILYSGDRKLTEESASVLFKEREQKVAITELFQFPEIAKKEIALMHQAPDVKPDETSTRSEIRTDARMTEERKTLESKAASTKQSVRTAIESMRGKFTIMTGMADAAKFTEMQLDEFEIMALLNPNVKSVFYGEKTLLSPEMLKRLEKMQSELGAGRIEITEDGLKNLPVREAEKEKTIWLFKGEVDAQTVLRIKGRPGKNYLFRYVSEETGLVPMALLFADQHEKPFEKGMMDLSMASAMLRVAIQEFQNSVVFARAA